MHFSGDRIDKRVEKYIQNEIWAQIFFSDLHVYMAEVLNKTIEKISKTTTILNIFSNCCQFYFGVVLKNGKIGPRT